MRRRRDPISRLQKAIDCLPRATREAMLEGIGAHPVVCGAYTDGRGGICPMLAAHRHGGRVSFLPFSKAWDAYTDPGRPRRATEREVRTLEHLLLASLDAEVDLGAAISEHRRAMADPRGSIRARRLPASRPAAAGPGARTAW